MQRNRSLPCQSLQAAVAPRVSERLVIQVRCSMSMPSKDFEMRRRSLISLLVAATAATTAYLLTRVTMVRSAPTDAVAGGKSTNDGMMDMMAPANMRGPMRTGMELFERHGLMRRTVTEIPGGVHDVTESDDPATASLIQRHVAQMYDRVEHNQPFPYTMSRSVPAMFANSTRYRRKLVILPKGVAVTETSDDPEMVAIIRVHAQELNDFVKNGMPAMMRGMMQ
jgi:hypothetical protein